jgi:hypothetical protein
MCSELFMGTTPETGGYSDLAVRLFSLEHPCSCVLLLIFICALTFDQIKSTDSLTNSVTGWMAD